MKKPEINNYITTWVAFFMMLLYIFDPASCPASVGVGSLFLLIVATGDLVCDTIKYYNLPEKDRSL